MRRTYVYVRHTFVKTLLLEPTGVQVRRTKQNVQRTLGLIPPLLFSVT